MLRPSLIAKKPEATHIKKIAELATQIIADMDRGQACDDKILEMAAITGDQGYDRDYFAGLHCHSSIKEFAREAALPLPQQVSDITRDELVDIVRRMIEASFSDTGYYRYYSHLFEIHVPLSGASALDTYPVDWYDGQDPSDYNPTSEEIIKIATAIVEMATSRENVIRL